MNGTFGRGLLGTSGSPFFMSIGYDISSRKAVASQESPGETYSLLLKNSPDLGCELSAASAQREVSAPTALRLEQTTGCIN